MEPQPTTSEQSTLKVEKCLLWDPDPDLKEGILESLGLIVRWLIVRWLLTLAR